jgi:hypothetical protein
MNQNQKAVVVLSFLFFFIFAGMIVAGTGLLYKSAKDTQVSETNVKISAGRDGWELELTTAIPGIVLIVLGTAGLLLKVSVREIGGYGPTKDGVTMSFLVSPPMQPMYGGKTLRVPLPVWWLIKSTGLFARVNKP